MNVIPFPQEKLEPALERDETIQGVEQMLAMWRDAIQNLEYTLARLSDVRNEVEYAAAYRLIENALADLKAIDPADLSNEESRAVLCKRLKSCSHILCQSFQLICSR